VTEASLSKTLQERVKRYLRWYSYPLIYFFVIGVACVFARYTRPVNHRAGVDVIFKTVAVVPSLIWTGAVTVWIALIIAFIIISFQIRRKFPKSVFWSRLALYPKFGSGSADISVSKYGEPKKTFWKSAANFSTYSLGLILIFVGLTLGVWIARPYISLLLSSSKVEALEKKVRLQQVYDNRIIIPSVLVDAPILEGVSRGQLSRGVCHVSNSPLPGQGGNCIIEGHNLAEFGLWKSMSFFSLLDTVSEGTPIYVFYNGRKYPYKVKVKTYRDVGEPKLFDAASGERLTLLTCVSTWSPTIYTNRRTIVIADPEF